MHVTHPLHPMHGRYPFTGPQQPFRARMRRRGALFASSQSVKERAVSNAPSAAGRRTMWTISVKRQRKLKMKKHKYKKLMKKTRNLRRRLDRN